MNIDTKTYARRNNGSLAVYAVTEVASYEEAIDLVKAEEGVERALCLVQAQPEPAEQPIEDQEAA